MGITLPFEGGLNSYVTPDLAFEYHYFFTRKLWMVFYCQALVAAPGGFGTLDELFEVLTLKQTGKVQRDLPVVLIGKKFWNSIVNWQVFSVHVAFIVYVRASPKPLSNHLQCHRASWSSALSLKEMSMSCSLQMM